MRFGSLPLAEAEDAILAHSLELSTRKLRKGQRLDADALALIAADGRDHVVAARLETGDLDEDAAAARIGAALGGPRLRVGTAATGRVNLHAESPGLLGVDAARVAAANALDPTITLATLRPLARVAAGQMVATVKIISYGAAGSDVDAAAEAARGALVHHPPAMSIGALIETTTSRRDPGQKGERALAQRLERLGLTLAGRRLVPHEEAALAQALAEAPQAADILFVLTASATSDPLDVGPAALLRAGGRVTRFGMPVDPGNLLFLGDLGGRPVIGLPGCARSPALNGADWVMERVICGLEVTGDDIAAMGVGGLLKEVPARGRPREAG